MERARGSLRVLRSNVDRLGAEDEVTVVDRDVFQYLDGLEAGAFDVALADPPYGKGDARRLVERFLETPFAQELWLEHPWRESPSLPEGTRTRRYGDTALTTITGEP